MQNYDKLANNAFNYKKFIIYFYKRVVLCEKRFTSADAF